MSQKSFREEPELSDKKTTNNTNEYDFIMVKK